MALLNILDTPAAEAALRSWLSEQLPEAQDVEIADLDIPQSAGMSMMTVMFRASWREDGVPVVRDLVARVAPTGGGIFKDTDLVGEYGLLRALSATDVPVPTPYWVEESPDVLGSPFMVVQRIDGRVPSDDPPFTVAGWCLDLDLAGRAKLWEGALQMTARVHALDWQQLGVHALLDEPQFGAPGVEQDIGHWEDVYAWASADGVRSETIDVGLSWVRAHAPTPDKLVLNWGDARPGNIIYGPDVSVRAVLDWEMASISSPQLDIGWLAFMHRYFTEGIGAALPDGMPTREQLIARYGELTGNATGDVDFWEAFGALKLAICYLRVGSLMIGAGKLPADSPIAVNNPCSQIAAKLTGAPLPSGETSNYVGNR